MKLILVFLIIAIRLYVIADDVIIKLNPSLPVNNKFKLPQTLWSSTGLSSPAPIDNALDFYLSTDVILNFKIIKSLPYLRPFYLRAHWIFNDAGNFTKLDKFVDTVVSIGLLPSVEFMGDIGNNSWSVVVYNSLGRWIVKYGAKSVSKWRFETWNEPDLKNYNILNFNKHTYLTYLKSIANAVKQIEQENSPFLFRLRGPAGLFKKEQKHPLCWGVLEYCNKNILDCPFDVLTFHRKGLSGEAREIIDETVDLIDTIHTKFPVLKRLPYANTEGDPLAQWSHPNNFYADVRYAAILVRTVLLYIDSKQSKVLQKFESLSHDNAFISYFPYVFTQRTLLARFQMNLTNPVHTKFIQKPVYSALGLLGHLGNIAGRVVVDSKNIMHITTINRRPSHFYLSSIIVQSNGPSEINTTTSKLQIKITGLNNHELYFIFMESIEQNKTDPYHIWQTLGSPPYPDSKQFALLRRNQTPKPLGHPQEILNNSTIYLQISNPFIVALRICTYTYPPPSRPTNLNFHKIFKNRDVLIYWQQNIRQSRCIKTYEIFYKQNKNKWIQITRKIHIPFMSHHFNVEDDNRLNVTTGWYRIRSVDIFGRKSPFSKMQFYEAI